MNQTMVDAPHQFEATEANLAKLERLWDTAQEQYSENRYFETHPEYEDLCRAYGDVLGHLPKIDGWRPDQQPTDLNEIAQNRLDALELDQFEQQDAYFSLEESIQAPGLQLREYRYRFDKLRRKMIRETVDGLAREIDLLVASFRETLASDAAANAPEPPDNTPVEAPKFEQLRDSVSQIDTLLDSSVKRSPRWGDLRRHLDFGQLCDLRDIVTTDWPKVRPALMSSLYGEDEPLPVEAEDLADLVKARPHGPVPTRLHWEKLSEEDFERLIFNLISSSEGYENSEWLTRTSAPDRGRDLSVNRVVEDSLGGVERRRVIIQCKHWLTKSVSGSDVSRVRDQMTHWEPPRVDVLVIATSGRFTVDAVDRIEKLNASDRALRIESWPDSHLERLLPSRPDLIGEFGLR